jgi:hypothetical protein
MKHSILLAATLAAAVQIASALTYVYIPPELKAEYDRQSGILAEKQGEKASIDGMLADLWKQATKITADINSTKDPTDKAILQGGYMACLRMIAEYEAKRKQAEAEIAAQTRAVAEAKARMDAGTVVSQGIPRPPANDPNAPYRPNTASGLAEPMPEPNVTGGSSYVPGSKPGETPGMTTSLPGWAQTAASQPSAGSTTPTVPPTLVPPGTDGYSGPGWQGTLPGGIGLTWPPPINLPGSSGGHTHTPGGKDVPASSPVCTCIPRCTNGCKKRH